MELHITGEHEGWQRNNNTRLKVDKQGNWLDNLPLNIEIKAAITGITAQWNDGKWTTDAKQRLEILS